MQHRNQKSAIQMLKQKPYWIYQPDPKTSCFLSGVPTNCHELEIIQELERIAPKAAIDKVTLIRNKNGELKGFGFVEFGSIKDAQQFTNTKFYCRGKTIKLRPVKMNFNLETPKTPKIIAKNVPADISNSQLFEIFSEEWDIKECYQITTKNNKNLKIACLEFFNKKEAEDCRSTKGFFIENYQIKFEKYNNSEKYQKEAKDSKRNNYKHFSNDSEEEYFPKYEKKVNEDQSYENSSDYEPQAKFYRQDPNLKKSGSSLSDEPFGFKKMVDPSNKKFSWKKNYKNSNKKKRINRQPKACLDSQPRHLETNFDENSNFYQNGQNINSSSKIPSKNNKKNLNNQKNLYYYDMFSSKEYKKENLFFDGLYTQENNCKQLNDYTVNSRTKKNLKNDSIRKHQEIAKNNFIKYKNLKEKKVIPLIQALEVTEEDPNLFGNSLQSPKMNFGNYYEHQKALLPRNWTPFTQGSDFNFNPIVKVPIETFVDFERQKKLEIDFKRESERHQQVIDEWELRFLNYETDQSCKGHRGQKYTSEPFYLMNKYNNSKNNKAALENINGGPKMSKTLLLILNENERRETFETEENYRFNRLNETKHFKNIGGLKMVRNLYC